jgi:hypothetical protein
VTRLVKAPCEHVAERRDPEERSEPAVEVVRRQMDRCGNGTQRGILLSSDRACNRARA